MLIIGAKGAILNPLHHNHLCAFNYIQITLSIQIALNLKIATIPDAGY